MADTGLKFIPHMNTKSCCYCFSSKTGCLIIGYLGAIGILLYMIVVTTLLLYSEDVHSASLHHIYPICVTLFYIHYLLIQGVNKQEPRKMYYWIYLVYIKLIVNAIMISLVIMIFFGALDSGKFPLDSSVLHIFVSLCIWTVSIGLGYHFFAAVVTHCQDLLLIQSGQQILTA